MPEPDCYAGMHKLSQTQPALRARSARYPSDATMPYHSTVDLPPAIKDHLPIHAQEIFLAAFNHAFEEYAHHADRERVAFRVAWAAVKRRYQKRGGQWTEK